VLDIISTIEPPQELVSMLQVQQGPSGPPGVGVSNTLVAQQALGGHRAVIAVGLNGADYANTLDEAHFGRVIGVTLGAADALAEVIVQTAGPLDETSWDWVPDTDIWLGYNGLLTQTPPRVAAFVQRVGFALTPTRIWVDLSEPVLF
jgi:hypothetical protein